MLITMLTTGSRGDTQPYIALGMALKKKGHRVRIAASEGLKSLVEGYCFEYATIRGDVTKIMDSDLVKKATDTDNPLKFFTSLKNDELMHLFLDMQHDMYTACKGSDAIVYHPGATIGFFAAKELNIPSILASPFPMTPTNEYPNLIFYDKLRLGKVYNKLTHKAFEIGFWKMTSNPVKKYLANTFGRVPKNFSCPYPKQRTKDNPTITSISPNVFPKGKDMSANVYYDGYWFLEDDASYQPPEELKNFLAAGEAPVYIGFGSMGGKKDAAETTAMVVEALERSGKRGIIAGGWGAIERPKEEMNDIFFIEGAPHHWLFPRMSAVVHHGGAATTAEGLRAGVPTTIIPFANDQYAWGKRVEELGVGAKAIPRKQLTVEKLTDAIKEMQSNDMKEKAKALGAKIRTEKGAERGAEVIINCVKNYKKK